MEEAGNINSKEVILPKLWILILGILSAILFPPIGIIWGIFLLIKKYRGIGIAFIGGAVVSAAVIALIINSGLIFKKEERLSADDFIFEKFEKFKEGEVLPEEFQNLRLQKLQTQTILELFEKETLKGIVSPEQARKLLELLEGSLEKLTPEQIQKLLELLEEIEYKN